MKREWSGCERRRCTLGRYRIPYRRRSVPRRRVVLLRRAFQHPARSRPSRSDALPAQLLRQADWSRGRIGQDLSNPAPAGGPSFRRSARTRVAGSQTPCRRRDDGKDVSQEHTEDAATGWAREGPVPDGPQTTGAQGVPSAGSSAPACTARSRRGLPRSGRLRPPLIRRHAGLDLPADIRAGMVQHCTPV